LKKIRIDPLTRAHSPTAVEVVVENKKVINARCIGTFFRGFEIILRGRDPRDAPYLTERICGICSSSHGTAACFALEDAAGARPPRNGNLLRNLILGSDILQNQIRHFYLFALPDFVRGPNLGPFAPSYTKDYRLPKKKNDAMIEHYFRAIEISRQASELIALLGGKSPFPHGLLAGGSSVPPTADIIMTFRFKLKSINDFIKSVFIPDAFTLAETYRDYYQIGVRKPNMMSFGLFPRNEHDNERHFPAGAVINGQVQRLNTAVIKEDVTNSWYVGNQPVHPTGGRTEPDREKRGAYSWSKAPRYGGRPMEGGPLARLWLSGNYRRGVSTMDRNIARVVETEKIGQLMEGWLAELQPGEPVFTPFDMPKEADGVGLTDAPRGQLGHWLRIEKGRIANYEIITPTAWNFSPRDESGHLGPVEEALIGTPVEDENEPIEVGRVVRAFDLCSSCVAHVIIPGRPVKQLVIVP